MNSSRSATASAPAPLKAPRKDDVDVTEPGFSTPRIVMHMCVPSTMTATPRAPQCVATASAI